MITYLLGDVREKMSEIPDASIALVATSPPFYNLRSYLADGHDDKAAEIGSERTPAAFLDTLLELTAAWGRVLTPWGSIAVELGDSYHGSGGAGGDYNADGLRAGQAKFKAPRSEGGPLAKSLLLIPELYAIALAYGINPLTGHPSPAGKWRVRNVITWHRPNPAVGRLGDKVRPSTSYITVATRSPKRWFDLTAVRTPHKGNHKDGEAIGHSKGGMNGYSGFGRDVTVRQMDPAGAPPLDCWFDQHDTWTLTTSPSKLAHFAMWPPRLAERLILMMCPEWVCATCGEPRRRIEGTTRTIGGSIDANTQRRRDDAHAALGRNGRTVGLQSYMTVGGSTDRETLGWSDCGHDNYRPGVVLDSFAGTGTTLAVAELHNRDSIGIDLDETNEALLPRRIDECKRVLYGTQPELPGQQNLFTEAAS